LGKSLLKCTKADPEKRTWIREKRANQGTHAEENDPISLKFLLPTPPPKPINLLQQSRLPIINPLTPWRPNQTTNNKTNKAQQSKTLPADFSNYGPVTDIITDPLQTTKTGHKRLDIHDYSQRQNHSTLTMLFLTSTDPSKNSSVTSQTLPTNPSLQTETNQPSTTSTTVPNPQIYPQNPKPLEPSWLNIDTKKKEKISTGI